MEKIVENIKFSIVIPTYNRAGFIRDTIESVLCQDYTNFEIIVVDDGSTDNTEEVVNFIKDKRLNYLKKKNEERGAARNVGFRKTTGDYVLFFDSDDLMHKNHLSVLNEAIVNLKGQVNFIATKYDFIRDGHRKNSSMLAFSQGWYTIDVLLDGNMFACHFCVKRSNPNLKPFVEDRCYSIMEDWLFLMQNLINDNIYIIDKVTISIIDHDNRSMRGDNATIINKKLIAGEWIMKNIPLPPPKQKILTSNIYYFCAIHSYIDHKRKNTFHYLKKAISINGLSKKVMVLFLKNMLGYGFINSLKSIIKK